MSITTVAELIDALERLPGHLAIGTMTVDYVGDKFEPSVRVDTEFVKTSGRIGVYGESGVEVVVIR